MGRAYTAAYQEELCGEEEGEERSRSKFAIVNFHMRNGDRGRGGSSWKGGTSSSRDSIFCVWQERFADFAKCAGTSSEEHAICRRSHQQMDAAPQRRRFCEEKALG